MDTKLPMKPHEFFESLTSTCNHQKTNKHPIEFMQSRGFLL